MERRGGERVKKASEAFLTLLFTFLLVATLNVGGVAAQPNALWTKTYGGAQMDEAFCVIQTSDGGYATAGSTMSAGSMYDFWLVKTDANGNPQWNRTYGGIGYEIARSVVQTVDGGYALAGVTSSSGAGSLDFWLVKTNASGVPVWGRTYGGAGTDYAYSMIQTSDGGYALAGETDSYGDHNLGFWLVKTDANGNAQWNKTFFSAYNDEAFSVVQTIDLGYALAGPSWSPKGAFEMVSDFWLVKTNANGDAQWNKTYGGTGNEIACSVVQTGDGGYALAGSTDSYGVYIQDFCLLKTDAAGNALWNKTYGGTSNDAANSMVLTNDGGFAIAGTTESSPGNYDFWLVRTDYAGNALWNKTYGGTGFEGANSVADTSDGGYIIAGAVDVSESALYDFFLVKTAVDPVPEFSSWLILSLALTATSFTVIGRKRLFRTR